MKATTVVSEQELLLIDDDYDRTRASDGFSRYGAYLAMRLPAVADGDPEVLTDPIRWAAFAWASATVPVMCPGYVTWNDPIEDIELNWDDGRLGAEIVLRTPLAARLDGWRGWERDLCGNLVEPWHADRVALSRLCLRAVLDVALPDPPGQRTIYEQNVRAAKLAVSIAAGAVEKLLVPVLLARGERCRCRQDAGGRP
jgi:hypothetical protein